MHEVIDKATERLKHFEPPEGYYLAFSGGKDSIVIKALADMSGVKYDAHYNNTTIDPPELVRFIKKYHPDVKIENPDVPFLKALQIRGFPRRQSRWCCEMYKEKGGTGRLTVTGIRWQESRNRNTRKMVEICFKDKTKTFLHVIIDWSDKEVWNFIREHNLPYCELYDKGFSRIGCLMCPYAPTKRRIQEYQAYPQYAKRFVRAFEKLYERGKHRPSMQRWKSGKEMFEWWLTEKIENPNQQELFT